MHNIKMQRTADVSTGLLYDSLAAADLGVGQALFERTSRPAGKSC